MPAPGEPLRPAGGAAKVELTGEFYVGLGVSAHDTGTDRYGRVLRRPPGHAASANWTTTTLVNTLETISLRSKDRRVAYVVTQPGRIEAPNWFPDATNTLYFNNGGKLYKVQADPPGAPRNPNRQAVPEPVDLGMLTRINNDHGVTADGKPWAISDQSQTVNGQRPSLIYIVPVGGGRRAARHRPRALLLPWLVPDGKTLTYCAAAERQLRRVHGPRRRRSRDGASPRRRAKTTVRSTRRTGSTSTSTPTAPARCRSGG